MQCWFNATYHCFKCNVVHQYDDSVLDFIEIFYKNYYIYLNLKHKYATLNKEPFFHICDLNFETSLNINPQNIKDKINIILTYL
jgi:hypothetical protein